MRGNSPPSARRRRSSTSWRRSSRPGRICRCWTCPISTTSSSSAKKSSPAPTLTGHDRAAVARAHPHLVGASIAALVAIALDQPFRGDVVTRRLQPADTAGARHRRRPRPRRRRRQHRPPRRPPSYTSVTVDHRHRRAARRNDGHHVETSPRGATRRPAAPRHEDVDVHHPVRRTPPVGTAPALVGEELDHQLRAHRRSHRGWRRWRSSTARRHEHRPQNRLVLSLVS